MNGINIVLEALNKLNRKVIFVGDGSYREKCEKYGKVTGMLKDVNKYLEKADLVIASSYLSIMEAMALSKPVIAIATNLLKLDYLNCHPMAEKIRIVETADELVDLMRSDFSKRSQISQSGWAIRQTPDKLAELYLRLWIK